MKKNSAIYHELASFYEAFEGEMSRWTWRHGIVAELGKLGCCNHRILDLGAGTGIGRRLMADRFPECRVMSLDQSQTMLDFGQIPEEFRIIDDMSRFDTERAGYDFVVSGYDALNYLSEHELQSCLQCVASALKPSGKMIFDYSSRKLIKYDWGKLRVERTAAGVQLTSIHDYDAMLDRTRVKLLITRNGQEIFTETHHHYSIDPYLLHELASTAGLSVQYVRDIDRQEFSPSSTTHVYVIEKTLVSGASSVHLQGPSPDSAGEL
jgi:SAM-dependent methyltransferase